MEKIINNPWPGLSSYEDPFVCGNKYKFCGRDSEVYDVVRRIDDNFFVTLYGKSGIGKSSLLKAGVFPYIRKDQYLPLMLRLGLVEESDCFQPILINTIVKAVKEQKGYVETIEVVKEEEDTSAVEFLWNFFARHKFYDERGNIIFPVVVLDQFEEVFRKRHLRRKAKLLLSQINYLIDENHALGDCIVNGQYAIIEEKDGHFYLKKALDLSKDQSYVLYELTEDQLVHTAFPLGELSSKSEVREIAEREGFVTSHKSDSQDICFVPDGNYAGLIKRYRGKEYPKGDFVDLSGNVLGTHDGIINYTIGQRRGLGIPADRRLYVTRLDVENNKVILADDKDLFRRELYIRDFNWITGDKPEGDFRCSAKIRYRHKEQPATVTPMEGGFAKIVFDEPQRAITAGQSAVLYNGDYVLGGGIIDHTGEF